MDKSETNSSLTEAIARLRRFKEGLENLDCVLGQCMQDSDWGLFEGNSELQALWRRFREEVYEGKSQEAVHTAGNMLQSIGPYVVVANFFAAVKSREFFPFELSFKINREAWDEFRERINSNDGTSIVRALAIFLERALGHLAPEEPQASRV